MNYKNIYNQYMYSYPHKRTYHLVDNLDLTPFKDAFVNENMNLYIHLPFCKYKCGYCNLFSVTHVKPQSQDEYISAVKRHSYQMKATVNFEQTTFKSFILGGGTPLLLSTSQLEELFAFVQKEYRFNFKDGFSVIETSPQEVNSQKLTLLKAYDFKRLSVGIQSFVKEELLLLERFENLALTHDALSKIKDYNFKILNLDLMYGIPNQTDESFLYTLETALSFDPEEIFLYPLYKQPNARLYSKFEIDHQRQYELYQLGRDYLLANGYQQLSMRSFSKSPTLNPDCGFENTLSLGCGGRSYFDNLHFCETYVSKAENCKNQYDAYIKKTNFLQNISAYELDQDELKRKYIIKNLFYITGLNKSAYKTLFGTDFLSDFNFAKTYIEQGYIRQDENRFYLTKEGMGLSDMLGPSFMSCSVKEKMNNYD